MPALSQAVEETLHVDSSRRGDSLLSFPSLPFSSLGDKRGVRINISCEQPAVLHIVTVAVVVIQSLPLFLLFRPPTMPAPSFSRHL